MYCIMNSSYNKESVAHRILLMILETINKDDVDVKDDDKDSVI